MKRVYIAHPLRGNVTENQKRVSEICQSLPKDIMPLSPIHNFGYFDPETYDQFHGMQLCFGLLALADELWVFGKWWTSEGCQAELAFAGCHDIPIRYKSLEYSTKGPVIIDAPLIVAAKYL